MAQPLFFGLTHGMVIFSIFSGHIYFHLLRVILSLFKSSLLLKINQISFMFLCQLRLMININWWFQNWKISRLVRAMTFGVIDGVPIFTSSKAYKHLLGTIPVSPIYNWLWSSDCLPKRKVFFWLALKDRLSTRELLKRKHMELQSYNCVLCLQNIEESLHHLFMDCPFALSC
jgi:hypothetical protein